MGNKTFDISVVMAVYNAEKYLREAVESLVHQTIGFDRIQLILVDDGSPDGSGAICDEYRAKYPNNVVVIHKENGRQASARNAGLKYVEGKYVNFMDSDDTMEKTAFRKAFDFMEIHASETDVCCIPIVLFGDAKEPHLLNYKFDQGSRVVDLMSPDHSDCILMNVISAFYNRTAVENLQFDTKLYHAEDTKFNLSVLMNKPRLGLVTGTKYNYRKHGGSTIDRVRTTSLSYNQHLESFSMWALDEAQARFGYVPAFVQHTVMYDLQWKLRWDRIPMNVLTDREAEDYRRDLIGTARRIDDAVILRQRNLGTTYKAYVLGHKYGRSPEVTADAANSDVVLRFGDTAAVKVSEMRTTLEFLSIDAAAGICTLEGFHVISFLDPDSVQPCLLVNGREIACERTDRDRVSEKSLGEMVSCALGFRAEFPLMDDATVIVPALKAEGVTVLRRHFTFRDFFPVSQVYDNAYACMNGRMIAISEKGVCITKAPSWPRRVARECKLLREIWQKDLLGGRKAVVGRLYYHIVKPFKRRRLWIISDRIMRADDNGEALFRYIMKHKPTNTRAVFAVSRRSADYARMAELGECVDAMSLRHKLLHLLCDVNISSAADGVTVNPFVGHHDALRDLLTHQRFVFLQHGVIQDDLSNWLNRFHKNIDGFVTAAAPECASIVEGDYGYSPEQIWLTGLPRFDLLYENERKKITLMPTWRQYLMEGFDSQMGVWKASKNVTDSQYYRFYTALLNSSRLMDALERCGYTLQFFLHPIFRQAGVQMPTEKRVICLPTQTSYREIYAESSLVVTDYSSAVFDFAYMRKPLVYCQFDKEEFFGGNHTCTQGYFDYERDGFGEVEYTLEGTIDRIIEYAQNGCQLKEEYRRRIDGFFAFNDQNNCARVLEKIEQLSAEK